MRRVALWIPTVTMLLVSLISYIDRNTLALLAPTILKDTHLTAEQYGFVISAFSVAYMIGNPVWGRWLDRFGLRTGMAVAVALWTLASTSHALAAGFLSFAIARAALGFGEGATFPGGLRTVMQTLPPSKRSRGVAVAYSGGSLGAIVTPILITPIALWWGWQAAFLFTGLIGATWLAVWFLVSRRSDVKEHRRHSLSAEGAQDAPRFKDPRLWSFMLAYAFGALPIALIIYGGALYLNRALGASQALIGKVLWIPPLGWEIGYFFWGWLADRMTVEGKSPITPIFRLLTAATVLSLPLAFIPAVSSFGLVMFQLFLAMFVAGGILILTVAYATRTYSPSHSGLIAGLGAGAWSAAVACVMPVFGRLFDLQRYDLAFLLAAACPVLGYLIWLWINRDIVKPR
ncbi:MAG TPA: MFS transporter [Bryobacteraceae bacterium]|nr:MFS transporter [Bryobacteraceae bacterium]